MALEVVLPFLVAAAYRSTVALLAGLGSRIPGTVRLVEHPLVFGLALGIYATSWTFHGSVGFAARYGYGFLAISLGPVLACLAIPSVWLPLSRIVQRHRLASVADLFAFRYQSQAGGILVTLFLLAGLLPYLSLQLRAIADAASALAGDAAPRSLGLAYAALLSIFAALLGARYAEPWGRSTGLVAAVAAESVVKLVAIVAVGLGVLGAFGGLPALEAHLAAHPEAIAHLYEPVRDGPWGALLLSSFVAAFLLPRQFHMAFVARPSERALLHATWTLPAFLLLLNVPLALIWLAGSELVPPGTPPDLYVLVAAPGPLRTVAFLGGVAASSSMVLVSSVALSGMVVNHLVVPLGRSRPFLYRHLRRVRRVVIGALVLAGFALHGALQRGGSLVDLGLVSFAAVLQCLPGVVGTLFWRRATRTGLLLGLVGGIGAWMVVTLLPLFGVEAAVPVLERALGFAGDDPRSFAVWVSLAANGFLFAAGSLATQPTSDERAAGVLCASYRDDSPSTRFAAPESEEVLRARLARVLGAEEAQAILSRARAATTAEPPGVDGNATPLARLAEEVERELAERVGPLSARLVTGRAGFDGTGLDGSGFPPPTFEDDLLGAQLRFLEERLAHGGAVDALPRYLLGLLDDLPVGLCAIHGSRRVTVWNRRMAQLTGIAPENAQDTPLDALPSPWGELLADATESELERTLGDEPQQRTLRWHRAPFADGDLVVVEDLTERRAMERQLAHQDRLASVGRLAAGVAHEVGNPLAGLLMVTKNLQREPHAPDAVDRLELVVREGERIAAIVRSLLTFSRAGDDASAGHPGLVPVDALAREAVDLVRLGTGGRSLRFAIDVAPGLQVRGDQQRLEQVLVNLLANARDASPDGAEILLRARRAPATDGDAGLDTVLLEVVDHGPGIPASLADRVFEPFVTSKEPGQGTGLGLAVAYRIVQDHGGLLTWERVEGETVFRVRLPHEAPAKEVP